MWPPALRNNNYSLVLIQWLTPDGGQSLYVGCNTSTDANYSRQTQCSLWSNNQTEKSGDWTEEFSSKGAGFDYRWQQYESSVNWINKHASASRKIPTLYIVRDLCFQRTWQNSLLEAAVDLFWKMDSLRPRSRATGCTAVDMLMLMWMMSWTCSSVTLWPALSGERADLLEARVSYWNESIVQSERTCSGV